MVRLREVYTSIDLILKALSEMPEGKIYAPLEKWPEGETFQRVEQPRGQVTYYIKGNGTRYLERLKIRTPTFANIPPLLAMLSGCELANAPVITLSIDPCIACTERMLKIEKVDKK
jgi:ech hydrogenase subunit E